MPEDELPVTAPRRDPAAMAARDLPRWPGGVQPPDLMSPDEVVTSPGYQFRLAEGEKAIRRASAAGSGVHSGATLKALQRYGQGLAAEEYDAARRREVEDYVLKRGAETQDHDLAREAFFDELGLYDRSRRHYYEDQGYLDARESDEWNRLMQLAGFGGSAVSQSAQLAFQAGAGYANARQYGVEGWGASRIGAGNEAINRAYGDADFFAALGNLLGDIWGDTPEETV